MNFKTLLVCTLILGSMTGCKNKKSELSAGIKLENIDKTVDPAEDFYEFACGGWIKNNPLKPEYARYGSFDEIAENNIVRLNGLIKNIADSNNKKGSIEQKIGDLFNLSMDSLRRNNEGYKPILPLIKKIEEVSDLSQFQKVVTELKKSGAASGFFYLYVDIDDKNSTKNILKTYQGGLSLSSRDYYIDDDKKSKDIRIKYLEYVTEMFQLSGNSQDEAKRMAQIVLKMETEIAKKSFSKVELRNPYENYNGMTIDEVQKLTPNIEWNEIFKVLGLNVNKISVGQKKQLIEVNKLLTENNLEDLKILIKWQVINEASSFLSDDFFNESFNFYSKYLKGKEVPQAKWKRSVKIVNNSLGMAVGKMYVDKYFSESAKNRMLDLVHNLQRTLGQRIMEQQWMNQTTKDMAIDKLNHYIIKIGYPDKWRDYSALSIDKKESYYQNMLRVGEFNTNYNLSKVDKDVDKTEWQMTPQTVNAYYNPTTNEVCFPAGILQYPFFDMSADDAFNYGAIGVVIGHEMTHGFDDQGSLYDKNGTLNEWWTAQDRINFKKQTKAMADYFSHFIVAPGVHANGKMTLGENIADHGGLEISYQAFQSAIKDNPLDDKLGFTPDQRFFLAFSNVWANNIRPKEILSRTKTDVHSLGKLRVNGALPQIDAWYKAFNITKESPMYVAPKNRVKIW